VPLPTIAEAIIGLFPRSGAPFGALASTDGSSTRAGDGALISSPAPLLGGGVVVVPSSLVGTAASVSSRVGVLAVTSSTVGALAG